MLISLDSQKSFFNEKTVMGSIETDISESPQDKIACMIFLVWLVYLIVPTIISIYILL